MSDNQKIGIDALMPASTETDFVTVWRTTADAETITLPLKSGFSYNATVDWGDGSISTITAFDDADRIHTYTLSGDYIVRISGVFEAFYFNGGGDKLKMIHVSNLGNVGWTGAGIESAFYGCTNLVYFNGNGDTSSVTSMSNMLRDFPSMIKPPDLSSFNTSSVTNVYLMMYGWSSMIEPPDLSSFNTSSVIIMSGMMHSWPSMIEPPDLSSFNTSSVTAMDYMMHSWESMIKPPDLSSFNTSSVTTMQAMMNFWPSMIKPPDLSSFNTSSVIDMAYMMQYWSSMGAVDLGISTWDVSSVTTAINFLISGQLTTEAYDAMLINMDNQTLQSGVTWHFGNSTYTLGGAAEAARTSLINNDGLIITDGGGV